jgi:hypothetical protein
MNARTAGAWIIHHANKLKQIDDHDFDDIDMAGKSGKLLSGLVASDEESILSKEKVNVIAKSVGINKAELPTLIEKLKAEHLIDQSATGEVVAIGVTTSAVLEHTRTIFTQLIPNTKQQAAISLAEKTSSEPINESLINEFLSDTYHVPKDEAAEIIRQSEEIGFIDSELVDDKKVLFNGNLFKSDSIKKATKILDSLNQTERKALVNIDQEIAQSGCITFDKAERIAGRLLLEKVQSIGLYEFSKVSNSQETKLFVTKPEAFSKFGQPFEEDALDLAKALVASLSYGINYSDSMRGNIRLLDYLLRALIEGRTIGPAPAIGEDYKYLEIKRVVEVIPSGKKFYMRLLKKEVGDLAYQVMKKGDASETALLSSGVNITGYEGPEKTRSETRKKRSLKKNDADIGNYLRILRS